MSHTGNTRDFNFLFRTDKGRIDRATWWRGTVPLAAIALLGVAGWIPLRPYARHDFGETQVFDPLTLVAFAYLVVLAFAVILIAVCEYNLSAKRFRDRGRPGALAGLLPGSLLLGSAMIWYIHRSFDGVPDWATSVVLAFLVLIGVWNVFELGIARGRCAP